MDRVPEASLGFGGAVIGFDDFIHSLANASAS